MRLPRATCQFCLLISGSKVEAVQDCAVDQSTGFVQPPFKNDRPSVHHTDEPNVRSFPFVSDQVCADIVRVALEVAASQGWTTDRHKKYPTTDLDVKSIPQLWALVGKHVEMLEQNLTLSEEYGAAAIEFHDVFLVRYAEDGQRALDLHEDGSRVTFQLALNAGDEFQDGGTWFEEMGCRLQPDLGHAMTFPGGLKHAGLAISGGERFVLVGFSRLPDAEDDQNMHASFGLHYDVSLGGPSGDSMGLAAPCREVASPMSALQVSVSWHGCDEDVFTVTSSIRGAARWLWLRRESGQKCTSEALHERDLRLLYATSPDEADLLHLLQLPPGHDYEALPLKGCRLLDAFRFANTSVRF